MRHWQTVVDCGIRTIIELRNEDHSDLLCRLCKQYSIRYFAFPIDSHSAIDGFIGTDSIANSSIVINFPNKELHITSDTLQLENSIGMRDIHGLPIFEISINGIVLRAAFDSGAMYSFVSSHIVDKLSLKPLNQTFMDFNPMFGAFETSLFNGEIKVGETNLGLQTIAIGSGYDQSLQMLGIDAFIGIDALKNSEVGISFIERCIEVK